MMNTETSNPFNYPMPGRRDLMNLSTIGNTDNMKTTTKNFITGRYVSNNLNTSDIEGTSSLQDNNISFHRCITKVAWLKESQ